MPSFVQARRRVGPVEFRRTLHTEFVFLMDVAKETLFFSPPRNPVWLLLNFAVCTPPRLVHFNFCLFFTPLINFSQQQLLALNAPSVRNRDRRMSRVCLFHQLRALFYVQNYFDWDNDACWDGLVPPLETQTDPFALAPYLAGAPTLPRYR